LVAYRFTARKAFMERGLFGGDIIKRRTAILWPDRSAGPYVGAQTEKSLATLGMALRER
jgi:hypothetical protein